MNKIMLVALREIRQKVRQRGYIITTVALPLILLVVGLVTEGFGTDELEMIEPLRSNDLPQYAIGFVDEADLIQGIPEEIPADLMREYSGSEQADQALRAGQVEAYYFISEDYLETGQVERVSPTLRPNPSDTQLFEWLLIQNLDTELGPDQVTRLRWPFNAQGIEVRDPGGQGEGQASGDSMLPYLVGIIVMMPLFTSGSYLFQSLTQEKSSRVLELLLVSLRARQMLIGKVLGYGVLVILQYAIWAGLAAIASVFISGQVLDILREVNIAGPEAIWILPFAMGGFLLYAGIMAGLGAIARDIESSRVWIFIISLPMFIPIYLGTSISQSPNGPLAVLLSMIPFSAPVAMMLRLTSTQVPAWQLATSLALLLILGLGMIALMARIFRAQTLLSGETLSVRKFLQALA